MLAQFLLFCGFWFSMAVLGDCAFVEVSEPIQVRQDGAMATKLGMFSYTEMDTGRCYYWTDAIFRNGTVGIPISEEQQLEFYVQDVLGEQWYGTLSLAATAVVISLLWFLYVTSYCCSTQILPVRLFTGFMIAVVFVAVQGLTFLVLSSDWCSDFQCKRGRTAGFSIASMAAFFISGCSFFFMTNYPGHASLAMLQEEHHQHVMAGDEEAQTSYETKEATPEEREEEPPEEDLLPGDQDYEEGIEKALTGHEPEDPESAPLPKEPSIEEKEEEPSAADETAVAEADNKADDTKVIEAEAVPETNSLLAAPTPKSMDEGEA